MKIHDLIKKAKAVDFSGEEKINRNPALDEPDQTYIYALLDTEKKIIYIGRSKNIYFRIASHSREKVFIYWKYIMVPDELASLVELCLYEKYKPRLNRESPRSEYFMSLDNYRNKFKIKGKIRKVRDFLSNNPVETLGGQYPIEYLDQLNVEVNND